MALADFRPALCFGLSAASIGVAGIWLCPACWGGACGLTVYCTGMIYASLKSVQAWHTALTPLCYLLFAAVGRLHAGAFFAAAGGGSLLLIAAAGGAGSLAAAWTAKIAWRQAHDRARPLSTPETATGLGTIGQVRLFERPHMNENYLTREMGFRMARKHASKLAVFSRCCWAAWCRRSWFFVAAVGGRRRRLAACAHAGLRHVAHCRRCSWNAGCFSPKRGMR